MRIRKPSTLLSHCRDVSEIHLCCHCLLLDQHCSKMLPSTPSSCGSPHHVSSSLHLNPTLTPDYFGLLYFFSRVARLQDQHSLPTHTTPYICSTITLHFILHGRSLHWDIRPSTVLGFPSAGFKMYYKNEKKLVHSILILIVISSLPSPALRTRPHQFCWFWVQTPSFSIICSK